MGLLITLKDRDQVLFESLAEALPDTVQIGRGQECQWAIPKEFRMVGRVHARLVREKDRFFIVDGGSTNGTFLEDRRITKEALTAGQTFNLANTLTLKVAESRPVPEPIAASPQPSAVLPGGPAVSEALPPASGEDRGRFVGWTATLRGQTFGPYALPFIIGSSAQATLRLTDSLVSRKHAEIFRAPDGFLYLRDLGSANGTLLDGLPVLPDSPARLTHGARIFIAHLGMVYDDGRGLWTDKHLWGWGGAVVAALLVLLTVVRLLLHTTPDRRVAQALRLAAAGQFDSAKVDLDRAETEARSDEERQAVEGARAKLATLRAWSALAAALQRGDWEGGETAIKALPTEDAAAWEWGPAPSPGVRDASLVISLLTNVVAGRRVHDSRSLAGAAAVRAALDGDLTRLGTGAPECAGPLRQEAEQLSRKLKALVELDANFKFLESLRQWPPPAAAAVTELERMVLVESGSVKDQASAFLAEARRLAAALELYQQGWRNLQDLRITASDGLRPEGGLIVPSGDARLQAAAGALSNRLSRLVILGRWVREVEAKGLDSARAWENREARERVLACDVPAGGHDPLREKPLGDYDRYVGIESTYGYCRSLVGEQSLKPSLTPFTTELVRLKQLCQTLTNLLAALDEPTRAEAVPEGCKLAGAIRTWRQSLMVRERLVREMLEETARAKEPRRALIAAAIALQLNDSPVDLSVTDSDGRLLPLKTWAARKFTEARATLPGD